MAIPVYLIGGTRWSLCDWWRDDSPLMIYLGNRGLDYQDIIEWSGNVVLSPRLQDDWQEGATNVIDTLCRIPFAERNVIAHSHGGNIALLAAQQVEIRRLLTIGTPPRHDVPEDGMIGRWRHVIDKRFDGWGTLGTIGDRVWSLGRRMPRQYAENVLVPGVRHDRLLCDPEYFPLWADDGLIDFFVTEKR